MAVSGTTKRTGPKAVIEENGGTGSIERRNTAGETKEVAAKSKPESLIGEHVPAQKVLMKGDNLARGGVTKSLKK